MRLPIKLCLAVTAPLLLAGCMSGGSQLKAAPGLADNGPQDDYPVVLGDPFVVDGVTYTPEDVMNYDAVGYALAGEAQGAGVVAAHRTLPLPSYVEVTSLETGRTILVRLTSRGPMQGDALIGLSPDAATELGMAGQPSTAVRVRRVNPPEAERALLRAGAPVPARMDTPVALLTVLKRKLGGDAAAKLATAPARPYVPGQASAAPEIAAKPVDAAEPAPDAPAAVPAAKKGTFVQLGAFSSEANARKVASGVDAQVSKAGKYWIARMGPFASQSDTQAALAKARAAGYGEAIVRRVN
jgi:rare lipoprotein A